MSFEDFLQYEIVPAKYEKHAYIVWGATVGGIVYPLTMSWLTAIGWDLSTIAIIWITLKFVELLVEKGKTFLRILLPA